MVLKHTEGKATELIVLCILSFDLVVNDRKKFSLL